MKGKGYFIGERAGLLESKHIKAMGPSRWLFSWAIRRQTGTTRDGWGVVLYGNDLTYETIKADLGAPTRTLQRWMSRLVENGYFRTVLRPHGFKLFIAKPKKSRGENTPQPPGGSTGFPQNGTPKVADHGTPKVADHRVKSGGPLMADHSNKSPENNEVEKKVADHRSIKALEVKDLRRKEMLSPSAPVPPPSQKAPDPTSKPDLTAREVLDEIARIARRKTMTRAGPLSDPEVEQRRQYLVRQGEQIRSKFGK